MKSGGVIVFNKKIGDGLFHIRIKTKKSLKAAPGQFVNILVSESYEPFLRRPFSVFACSRASFDIVYKTIGVGTYILSEKKKGEKIDYIGPLGNEYPDIQSTEYIIIGGGTGTASVFYLARELKKKGKCVKFIQGAADKKQLLYTGEARKLGGIFTTDNGSCGSRGFVTGPLKKILKSNTTVFMCGPKPMFKAVLVTIQQATKQKKLKNISVFASFEEYMGCGIGACLSCVIKKKTGGYTRVCKEGPVFELKDIVL